MGHYDGMEEYIRERREENDKIIRPLTPEQFAATYLQMKIDDAERDWRYAAERIGRLTAQLNELKVSPDPKALEVLHRNMSDYEYKVSHDTKIRKILKLRD